MRRVLGAFLLLLSACDGRGGRPASSARPTPASGNNRNVVLLTIDTLRADHLGAYGYPKPTSPRIDAFASQAAVFDSAYTYWPKTRGSFVALLTGRRDSQTGYGKTHPVILGFNPTLASVLKEAGYRTAAIVDNGNLASEYGYHKGFDTYRETWKEKALLTEMDKTRAITEGGIAFLREAKPDRPFFLWLHYVNPHAPYAPPPPYDKAFLDARARMGPALPVVNGYHDGIPKQWAVAGESQLGYYIAQYDGEIATVDQEVGKVLDGLQASGLVERTVVMLTSDHGESLGEHGYYFDHGEDLFDPSLRIPLLLAVPGVPPGVRSPVLASTLDLVPTLLDAVKVSYPPDLAGASLLAVLPGGGGGASRERLFARNDRNLSATWDARLKVVAVPGEKATRYALYDRVEDPGETRDLAARRPEVLRLPLRELELFLERADREWTHTRRLAGEAPADTKVGPETCEAMKALGYVIAGCPQ